MFVTLWRQYKSILKVRGHHRGPLQNMKVKISVFKRHVYMLRDWSVVDFSGASVSSTQSRPKQTDNKRMTVEYVNTVFHRGATFSLEAAGPAGQRIIFQVLDLVHKKKRLLWKLLTACIQHFVQCKGVFTELVFTQHYIG